MFSFSLVFSHWNKNLNFKQQGSLTFNHDIRLSFDVDRNQFNYTTGADALFNISSSLNVEDCINTRKIYANTTTSDIGSST